MFDASVSSWQQMLLEKPCEMTLGASYNVIFAMCEYEISNGFEHIRTVFICSIYPPWFQMQFAKDDVSLCSSSVALSLEGMWGRIILFLLFCGAT